jgi:hypothetical protein
MRAALLRVWPLSRIASRFYQRHMRTERWAATNFHAKAEWASSTPLLDASQIRALRELRTVGIHIADGRALLGTGFDLPALNQEVAQLLSSPKIIRQIRRRRSNEGIKWYVIRVFGYKPRRPVPAAFASIVLNDRILDIVNSYLGLNSRIIYLDVWYNLPAADGEAALDSERWHRDGEDIRLVKLFLYLSDVDETTGPLSYFLESQPGGRHGALFPHEPPKGSFPTEDQLRSAVGDTSAISCLGPAGTLVLYDPCGFHRGGRARTAARIVLVATYGSEAAVDKRHYQLANIAQYSNLSPAASYAIRSKVHRVSSEHGWR